MGIAVDLTLRARTSAPVDEAAELRAALTSPPLPSIPSKYFYDERGSRLFDAITALPEYYLTRAEHALLTRVAGDIARLAPAAELVELGSGTASKTRVLLDAATEAGVLRRYVPFDVAESVVRESVDRLGEAYPGLELHGIGRASCRERV